MMNTYYATVGLEHPLGAGYFAIRAYDCTAAQALADAAIPTGCYLLDLEPESGTCHKTITEITRIAIDIETDGLEHKGGQILEICMRHLDEDLKVLATFQGILPFNTENFSDFILAMHTKTGLIHAVPNCTWHHVAEWLSHYENIVWLGSSVGFDARWMREHFPATKTSHRIIDTTSLVQLVDLTNRLPQAETKHRATDDVDYSIEVARLYRDVLLAGVL